MTFDDDNLDRARQRIQAAYDPALVKDFGHRIAAKRAAFMLRVAQSTFVKLAYNDRRRIDRKTWLSSLY